MILGFEWARFTDPEKAVEEIARVLAPGVVVGIATWTSLEETTGYAALVDLLAELFDDETANALKAPYALGDPDEVGRLISEVFRTPQSLATTELHDSTRSMPGSTQTFAAGRFPTGSMTINTRFCSTRVVAV